eukprot:2101594-Rhodomonas_salina.1
MIHSEILLPRCETACKKAGMLAFRTREVRSVSGADGGVLLLSDRVLTWRDRVLTWRDRVLTW